MEKKKRKCPACKKEFYCNDVCERLKEKKIGARTYYEQQSRDKSSCYCRECFLSAWAGGDFSSFYKWRLRCYTPYREWRIA